MIFEPLAISGAFQVIPEKRSDDRGFFARTFCEKEFTEKGIESKFVQESISYNHIKGTFRGLHIQRSPKEEAKLVRCQAGRALDIILDLRKNSPTYLKWQTLEISADNKVAIYIPKGCAHGFLTLEDHTELFYLISEFYHPELASGVRWNDPSFKISLPFNPTVISSRDLEYPLHA